MMTMMQLIWNVHKGNWHANLVGNFHCTAIRIWISQYANEIAIAAKRCSMNVFFIDDQTVSYIPAH